MSIINDYQATMPGFKRVMEILVDLSNEEATRLMRELVYVEGAGTLRMQYVLDNTEDLMVNDDGSYVFTKYFKASQGPGAFESVIAGSETRPLRHMRAAARREFEAWDKENK